MFHRRSFQVLWGFQSALILSASIPAAMAEVRTTQATVTVVEGVAKGFAAEKAGLQTGDVILSWRRAANPPANPEPASGPIISPFDLAWVELEQAPRGTITLLAKRKKKDVIASIASSNWALDWLPLTTQRNQAEHLAAKALLSNGNPDAALAGWLAAAEKQRDAEASWLLLKAARSLALSRADSHAERALTAALARASSIPFAAHLVNREWGDLLRKQSRWQAALERYQSARSLLDSNEMLAQARIDSSMGSIESARSRLDEAERHIRTALATRERFAPDTLVASASKHELANLAWQRRDVSAAETYYRQALAIREKLDPGGLDVAGSFLGLGNLAWYKGDLDAAEDFFRKALAIQERLAPSGMEVATSLYNLGSIMWNRNELDAAEDFYRTALVIRESHAPQGMEVAASLGSLGMIALERSDLPTAEGFFNRSLFMFERLNPGSLDVARTLNYVGNVAWQRGELAVAEARFLSALATFDRLAPGSRDVAVILNNLGNVSSDRGDLARAEEFFQRSLAIQQRVGRDGPSVANGFNALGIVALARGDLATAQELFRQSLAIYEKLSPDSLDVARALNNLGNVAFLQGDTSGADALFQQSLSRRERRAPESLDVAEALINCAEAARARSDLPAAEAHVRRALAIWEQLSPGSLNVALGAFFLGELASARGDLKAAAEHHRRALAIREQLAPASTHEAESRHAMGGINLRLGQLEPAVEYLCEAVAAIEQQKGKLGGSQEVKAGFAASYASYYHDCAAALVELGKREEAFHTLERSRARSLLTMLAERDLPFATDVSPELARQSKLTDAEYERTQAALSELNPDKNGDQLTELHGRLRELRVKQEEVAANIKRASPHYGSLKYPEPLDLASARSRLDPGTVLLAYSVGKEETLLFVVKSGGANAGFTVSRMPITERALRERVRAFRELIQRADQHDLPKLASTGAELYDLLLKPAEAAIVDSERVLISPDGPLHTLPFVSLTRRSGKKAMSQYFVQWRPVHVVASATVYAELQRNRRERESTAAQLVAFGDPKYPVVDKGKLEEVGNAEMRSVIRGGFKFTPLPASRKEVEQIASLYPGRAEANLGEEATEEKAKTVVSDTRYLHFATHGYVNERFPLDSALVLSIPEKSDEGRDNGLLQAWEVFDRVRIDADLVTLSACETGLGKEMGGEGLVGLTRAFQYAGARSVLASLWAVSDESTAVLMKSLYSQLKLGRTKDEALRAAQIEMIDSNGGNGHPFHWAAFEVIGDWR